MPPKKDEKVAVNSVPAGEHKGLSQTPLMIDTMVGRPKMVWTVETLADATGIGEPDVELYLRVLADAGVVRRIDADVERDTYRWMWVGFGPGGRG